MKEEKNKKEEEKKGTEVATTAPPEPTMSERFTEMVIREFSSLGQLQLSDYQRRLVQGYFIITDRMLKDAEEERLRKNKFNDDHKWDNDLAFNWKNVNISMLAIDAVYNARMGLDMMQKNMVFPIPFKNTKTQKYDIEFMPGYNGIRYKAEKYAVKKPLDVICRLVYTNDTFKPVMKSKDNPVENYVFEVTKPFDRGTITGGFIYYIYDDEKENKLLFMTLHDIEKRKPKKAAVEFWGGIKTTWKNGKKEGDEKVEGWFAEMCEKTLIREAYSEKHVQIDPQKVDDTYQYLKIKEVKQAEKVAEAEIAENANKKVIDTSATENKAEPDKAAENKDDDIPFAPEVPDKDKPAGTPTPGY